MDKYHTIRGICQGTGLLSGYNDLHELMLSHPIESVRGRYGGGYKVADWYHPQLHTLCAEQIKVLKKAASLVSAEDQLVIRTILEQFAP